MSSENRRKPSTWVAQSKVQGALKTSCQGLIFTLSTVWPIRSLDVNLRSRRFLKDSRAALWRVLACCAALQGALACENPHRKFLRLRIVAVTLTLLIQCVPEPLASNQTICHVRRPITSMLPCAVEAWACSTEPAPLILNGFTPRLISRFLSNFCHWGCF